MSVIQEMPAIIFLTITPETVWYTQERTTTKHSSDGLGILHQMSRNRCGRYLNNFHDSDKEIYKDIICLVMRSVANLCIIPMQDYLGLGNEARINKPSTLGCNWKWRMTEGQFSKELRKEMKTLAKRYGRLNPVPDTIS